MERQFIRNSYNSAVPKRTNAPSLELIAFVIELYLEYSEPPSRGTIQFCVWQFYIVEIASHFGISMYQAMGYSGYTERHYSSYEFNDTAKLVPEIVKLLKHEKFSK